MSDLFGALTTAARSLDAHRFALEVVGHNLANVNTPGYSRRSASLAEIPSLDGLNVGAGVEVIGIEAARSPLLDRRIYQEQPAAGRERAVADQLGVVESTLGAAGHALDVRLSEFFDAFATLAEDPTSSVARHIVTVQGSSLSGAFQDLAAQFERVRRDVDVEVEGAITEINSLADTIASLNVAIVNATSGTSDALQDRRSQALQALSKIVDIGITVRDDGALDVTVGNGRALVAGENAYGLTAAPAPITGLKQVKSGSTDITSEITGGKLAGLLQVRDVMVPSYATRLDNLANSVISDVNALHAAGYDLDGNTGTNFFTVPATVAGAASTMSLSAAVSASDRAIAAAGINLPGDNQNARAIAQLRNGSSNPIDEWGALVHRVGADRQTSLAELETREDVLRQMESLRSQISGVSIDEEAATMMRFQRAYEANARFFGVVNSLIDDMMASVAR